jgi:hypothetical protein
MLLYWNITSPRRTRIAAGRIVIGQRMASRTVRYRPAIAACMTGASSSSSVTPLSAIS